MYERTCHVVAHRFDDRFFDGRDLDCLAEPARTGCTPFLISSGQVIKAADPFKLNNQVGWVLLTVGRIFFEHPHHHILEQFVD